MKSWLSLEMYKYVLKLSPLAMMFIGYYHFFINYEIQFYSFERLGEYLKLILIIGLVCIQSTILLSLLYLGKMFWKKAMETAEN